MHRVLDLGLLNVHDYRHCRSLAPMSIETASVNAKETDRDRDRERDRTMTPFMIPPSQATQAHPSAHTDVPVEAVREVRDVRDRREPGPGLPARKSRSYI